jgi:hypothetical protein
VHSWEPLSATWDANLSTTYNRFSDSFPLPTTTHRRNLLTMNVHYPETDPPFRLLTLWQPWAWACIYAGKDVENRGKAVRPGPLGIHAGQSFDPAGEVFIKQQLGVPELPELAYQHGIVLGRVQVTGHDPSDSVWAEPGAVHNHLEHAEPARPPFAASGQLGLFRPPEGWQDAFAHPLRPLTLAQERALSLAAFHGVTRSIEGRMPALERRGLVEKYWHEPPSGGRWRAWRVTPAGRVAAARLSRPVQGTLA